MTKTKTKKRKRTNENENTLKAGIKKSSIGVGVGIVSFFVLLFVFAFAVVKAELSSAMQMILAFLSALLSCFIGGYTVGRLTKKNGIVYGASTSLVQSVIISIVLLVVNRDIGLRTLIMAFVSLIAGVVGGVLAVNKKERRK